ncbi:MFS transporter [Flavivirga eckloniae]|uniref:MFS transporter n=1 Tax=Flavivirga eckloniae TaxID=1803846 RepID=A0A2K9PLJ3_9FLAO|nr:MFS transporter [Flavivirga eckloniae]AUP77895.1 MFS transporter [Flavivirga eckloniae]
MNSNTQKLSVKEKIGYALGDLSANLIFQTLMTFLAFFYTDIYKIAPETASAIIFFVGLFAALFFNPVMGAIADRTNTKWGKFRPWILWTTIPFGIIAILTFSTPDFSPTGKVIYAVVTYTLLLVLYAANNLPYSALSGVITGNMAERNSISSYRFIAVMVAQFIIQVLLYPIVNIVGEGDQAVGLEKVMTFLVIIGTIFLFITFFTTKERILPKPEQRSSIKEDLTDLFKNKPWVIMLFLVTLLFISLALKGGMLIYYFENYISLPHLTSFLEGLGVNSHDDIVGYGFGLFNAGGIIFMIVGIMFSKRLADKYGKRDVFGIGLLLATLFIMLFYFYPPESITLMFVTQICHGFFYGITIPLLWAMIADVADYSEWKNNRRATAIIFSAMMVGLKLGLTFGTSFVTGILSLYNYDSTLTTQAASTINGIKLSISIYAAIPFLIGLVSLYFYEINKTMELQIESELKERRNIKVTK